MLHVQRIELTNFATHAQSAVDLPERGLVCVTGANGAGKSSLVEAVATGLWGESLRGEAGWRAGEAGALVVRTDGVTAARKRSKAGAAKLEWFASGEAPVTYETTTKAQTALEELVGSFDVWRRTCVLSSLDSAAFSLARDADRKRLLEEFLGLGMFDTGLVRARQALKQAEARAINATRALDTLRQNLAFAEAQAKQAEADAAALVAPAPSAGGKDPAGIRQELARLGEMLRAADDDARQARAAVQEHGKTVRRLEQAGAALDGQAGAEAARLSRLRADQCPTCGQAVEDVKAHLAAEVARLKQAADADRAKVAADLAAANAACDAAQEQAQELEEEARALVAKRSRFDGDLRVAEADARAAEAHGKQRAALEARAAAARQKAADLAGQLAAAEAEAATATLDAAHLTAVEQVLGLRGVRAQVLDHALGALESAANGWLGRMPCEGGPLLLTLAGSTTQKSGSVVDAIALRVGGRTYASCSGGERRRVDVALLLALRDLAVAAHGRDGTIWCDEVFDALDRQGIEDAASALREMASDRLVVVVTHSPDLVAALRPDKRIRLSLDEGRAVVSASA